MQKTMPNALKTEQATFAGGCFWCMQPAFQNLDGVIEATVGYAGGIKPNPTYENYAQNGYVEALHIIYDPMHTTYETLVDIFLHQIDPTDAGGQFADRGPHYRAIIFYHHDEQKKSAEQALARLKNSGKFSAPIMIELLPASTFYPAEEYHQDYKIKNPLQYAAYRKGSGRDAFIKKTWSTDDEQPFKKPSAEELQKKLTPLQYAVTQRSGTEPAFDNAYCSTKQEGIYVDIVSGEPLFSSHDKFDSGTGWPSFTKPLEPANIVEKKDTTLPSARTEIRSKHADSHLGHVFNDGPQPTGMRYCMNSAALRFIPVSDLEKEGLGRYKKLFEKK